METRVMKYFLKIAESGSMTKAAKELHITQPTLSRQIRELEDSLGTPLFSRENKRMTLTSAGLIFQERSRQIVRMIDKAAQDIRNQKGLSGTIAIGCVESSAADFLGVMITGFHKKYPEIHFALYDADGDDIREKMDNDLVDLGFLLSPVEIAKYDSLLLPVEDSWALAVPRKDPLAQKNSIPPDELTSLPLIVPARSIVQEELNSWIHISSESLHIVGSQNLLSNSLFLAKSGIGYILCTAGAFMLRPDPDMVLIPISTDEKIRHMMTWKKNKNMTVAVRTFVDFIKKQVSSPDSLWQQYLQKKK